MSSKKYPELSKAIRERETHSRGVLRKAIRDSVREAKSQAWNEKRSYGWYTRHLLLTYAMLRGLPYAVCERNCHEAPSCHRIEKIAEEFGAPRSNEFIQAWVQGEEPPVETSAAPTPLPVSPVEPPPSKGIFAGLKRLVLGA